MSSNFHESAWSEFLIPVGDQKIIRLALETLRDGFRRASPNAKSRISDYIKPSGVRELFHLEDGMLWQPEDAASWFTRSDELPSVQAVNSPADPPEIATRQQHDAEPVDTRPQPISVRRSVRSDASIGTVKRQIEDLFGLPDGSVALCGPDGKPLRADALIRTLRNRWQ